MVIHFGYNKKQVLQALRYHFITRPEIKILLIVVNIFTIISAVLLYMHKIQPLAFLAFSVVWFFLIIAVWAVLPASIYKKNQTFKDNFSMSINDNAVVLGTSKGEHTWQWKDFSSFVESPYFFHLYFNSRSFFLVPKDSIEGILEVQELRKLFREKIKK